MKYTIELVNNRPRCKVMTQNQRLFIIEGYELYQFLKEIIDDEEKSYLKFLNYYLRTHNDIKKLLLPISKLSLDLLIDKIKIK